MRFAILLSIARRRGVARPVRVAAPAPSSQPRGRSGTASTRSARRNGARLKSGLCTECHGDGFADGAAPELAGADFLAKWEGPTRSAISSISSASPCPTTTRARLPREQYADLVAYILAVNKFPTGATEIGTSTRAVETDSDSRRETLKRT